MMARAARLTSRRRANRSGLTLLELMLVVAVLAIVSSVAMLAMPSRTNAPDDAVHRIADARTRALRTGRPVTVIVEIDSSFSLATAMPDGRVLADPRARIDAMSGQPLARRDGGRDMGPP
jgi:prepilin-type N-terminal cleavage/methylation domain-containing protein